MVQPRFSTSSEFKNLERGGMNSERFSRGPPLILQQPWSAGGSNRSERFEQEPLFNGVAFEFSVQEFTGLSALNDFALMLETGDENRLGMFGGILKPGFGKLDQGDHGVELALCGQ